MVLPLIAWGAIGAVGIAGTAWALDETGQALDSTTRLVKWGAVAGGVYVSYRAMKSAGVI